MTQETPIPEPNQNESMPDSNPQSNASQVSYAAKVAKKQKKRRKKDPVWKPFSAFLGSILIPLGIAGAGYFFGLAQAKVNTETRLIELSVSVLRQEPSDETTAIRDWSVGLLAEMSKKYYPLSAEAQDELLRSRVKLGRVQNLNVLDGHGGDELDYSYSDYSYDYGGYDWGYNAGPSDNSAEQQSDKESRIILRRVPSRVSLPIIIETPERVQTSEEQDPTEE